METILGGSRDQPLPEALKRASELVEHGQLEEAKQLCLDAVRQYGEQPLLLRLLAIAAHRSGDIETAIGWLENAVRREGAPPDCRTQLAQLYRLTGRLDEAMAAGRVAFAAMPRSSAPSFALGQICIDRGAFDDAAEWLLRAITIDPEFAAAHLELGQLLLLRGEFRAGWVESEWRYRMPQTRDALPKFPAPRWNGMRMPRGRILLIGDQGYGDTIQFARFIPLVAERCREVIVGCSTEVEALIATVPGAARRVTRWENVPRFEAESPLSSLPGILGVELATIPAPVPYLSIAAASSQRWAERLAAALAPGALRVGLVWAGRPTHQNDRRRSMRWQDAAPLAAIPGTALASLQKEVPVGDRAEFAAAPGVTDLSPYLTDFVETAGAVESLDLVVTVDTSVAHLAGALGKPVWVLLP
ncbi:MAG TPA: tetratricopeptide repeat protein, partial [Stellaceae bacterium]|nr:tetratricopeptide repeat protein [Stellaceae bacterium]